MVRLWVRLLLRCENWSPNDLGANAARGGTWLTVSLAGAEIAHSARSPRCSSASLWWPFHKSRGRFPGQQRSLLSLRRLIRANRVLRRRALRSLPPPPAIEAHQRILAPTKT